MASQSNFMAFQDNRGRCSDHGEPVLSVVGYRIIYEDNTTAAANGADITKIDAPSIYPIPESFSVALAGFDSACTSIGFPIRKMHTISETGHTADVLAAIYGMVALFTDPGQNESRQGD